MCFSPEQGGSRQKRFDLFSPPGSAGVGGWVGVWWDGLCVGLLHGDTGIGEGAPFPVSPCSRAEPTKKVRPISPPCRGCCLLGVSPIGEAYPLWAMSDTPSRLRHGQGGGLSVSER